MVAVNKQSTTTTAKIMLSLPACLFSNFYNKSNKEKKEKIRKKNF